MDLKKVVAETFPPAILQRDNRIEEGLTWETFYDPGICFVHYHPNVDSMPLQQISKQAGKKFGLFRMFCRLLPKILAGKYDKAGLYTSHGAWYGSYLQ